MDHLRIGLRAYALHWVSFLRTLGLFDVMEYRHLGNTSALKRHCLKALQDAACLANRRKDETRHGERSQVRIPGPACQTGSGGAIEPDAIGDLVPVVRVLRVPDRPWLRRW